MGDVTELLPQETDYRKVYIEKSVPEKDRHGPGLQSIGQDHPSRGWRQRFVLPFFVEESPFAGGNVFPTLCPRWRIG